MALGIGGDSYYRDLGLSSLQRVSELQRNRNQTNSAIKSQHNTNMMSGAMSGAMLGTQVMPGYGTAIGAVAGALAGSYL